MRTHHLLAAALVAAGALSTAHAAPFEGADVAAGRQLHTKLCVECHARRFGGEEGSDIYTRFERRVTSANGLSQQITACTTMLNLDLFPEDELNLAGYLNQRFYHFK